LKLRNLQQQQPDALKKNRGANAMLTASEIASVQNEAIEADEADAEMTAGEAAEEMSAETLIEVDGEMIEETIAETMIVVAVAVGDQMSGEISSVVVDEISIGEALEIQDHLLAGTIREIEGRSALSPIHMFQEAVTIVDGTTEEDQAL
jgi:hypothetical protein